MRAKAERVGASPSNLKWLPSFSRIYLFKAIQKHEMSLCTPEDAL
jgi:hypothetical protein